MLILSALSSTAGQSALLLFILGVLVQSFDALYFPAQVLRHGDLTARPVETFLGSLVSASLLAFDLWTGVMLTVSWTIFVWTSGLASFDDVPDVLVVDVVDKVGLLVLVWQGQELIISAIWVTWSMLTWSRLGINNLKTDVVQVSHGPIVLIVRTVGAALWVVLPRVRATSLAFGPLAGRTRTVTINHSETSVYHPHQL